jgi:predicted alpha/beta superfamily hydrolase
MNKIQKAHFLFYFIGLSLLLNSCKKEEINPNQVKEFSIHSNNTGSDYGIWVVLPKNYDANLTYETIYLLDANWWAPEKIAKYTEEKSAKYSKQNAIVVGINNNGNERNRDFTPTVTSEGEGGSENYSNFIELELIPKIESDYSVDTTAKSRVLLGHSYGGLLTCYFFTKHPNIFNNYISLSASTWYDNDLLFQYETDTRVSNSVISNLVFIGCGELEEWSVVRAKEWNYRLSTFYPNCKTGFNKLANRNHNESALENAEIGIDFYYKNK